MGHCETRWAIVFVRTENGGLQRTQGHCQRAVNRCSYLRIQLESYGQGVENFARRGKLQKSAATEKFRTVPVVRALAAYHLVSTAGTILEVLERTHSAGISKFLRSHPRPWRTNTASPILLRFQTPFVHPFPRH